VVEDRDREDGISAKPAAAAAKGADPDLEAENRELRQRTKQLEQLNENLC
jgi:transposase